MFAISCYLLACHFLSWSVTLLCPKKHFSCVWRVLVCFGEYLCISLLFYSTSVYFCDIFSLICPLGNHSSEIFKMSASSGGGVTHFQGLISIHQFIHSWSNSGTYFSCHRATGRVYCGQSPPFTVTFTFIGNLDSPVNQTLLTVCLWIVRESQGSGENPHRHSETEQNLFYQMVDAKQMVCILLIWCVTLFLEWHREKLPILNKEVKFQFHCYSKQSRVFGNTTNTLTTSVLWKTFVNCSAGFQLPVTST